MKKNIKMFLEELYEIDWSLQEKEQELTKLIETMMQLSPKVSMDENFKSQLRSQIAEKIDSEKLKNYTQSSKPNILQIISYIFGWVWVAAFWFFIFQENFTPKTPLFSPVEMSSEILLEGQVSYVEPNTFGSLSKISSSEWWRGWGWNDGADIWTRSFMMSDAPETFEMTSDALLSEEDTSVKNTKNVPEADMMSDEIAQTKIGILPYPEWEYIPEITRYTFNEEFDFELPQAMKIYKKDSNKVDTSKINNLFKNINFNGVDLGKFWNLNVSSVSLNQNEEFGYSINLDFDNASFSLWKNWSKWPTQNYWENNQNPLLSEDEVLRIANDFLSQHNINLSGYWNPIIEQNYRNTLLRAESRIAWDSFYIPSPAVIFPLIIDGQEVHEEYGQANGVRIEIDSQNKKVSGLHGINISNYIASEYEIENNTENILQVANVWGRYGFYNYNTQDVKIIERKLLNPKIVYISTYRYENNISEQFIVPAVRFEIQKTPEELQDQYYTNPYITVPLIKDIYKYDDTGKIIWTSDY